MTIENGIRFLLKCFGTLFYFGQFWDTLKYHDTKAGEGGPQGEGQPGGQGVATPTPPQQQPSQAFPGPPSKAVTPKQLQGGAKVEKAPTGQEAPKANSKKSEPAPNVDTQTKPAQVKGKTTLNEKSTLNEKPSQVDKIQALFTPDPGMNF